MHEDTACRVVGQWLAYFVITLFIGFAILGGMFVWSMFCLWCIHMVGQLL